MVPHRTRYITNFWQEAVFSEFVNGRIDHNGAHPPHQHHFQVLYIVILEFSNIPEDLYKSIIYGIHCLVIMIDIAKDSLQAIAIVLLIESLLVPVIVFYTICYRQLQIHLQGRRYYSLKYDNFALGLPAHLLKIIGSVGYI